MDDMPLIDLMASLWVDLDKHLQVKLIALMAEAKTIVSITEAGPCALPDNYHETMGEIAAYWLKHHKREKTIRWQQVERKQIAVYLVFYLRLCGCPSVKQAAEQVAALMPGFSPRTLEKYWKESEEKYRESALYFIASPMIYDEKRSHFEVREFLKRNKL